MDASVKLSSIPASTAAASAPVELAPTDLALVPLRFNSQGECDNDATLERIIDVLSSQNSDDTVKAAIFIHAQEGNYKQFLNRLLRTIDDRHGPGTVAITPRVAEVLAARGIMFVSDKGTMKMLAPGPILRDRDRQRAISESLASTLSEVPTNIITLFDDQIVFNQLNRQSIIDIFRYGDPIQKNMIIEAACAQDQLRYLDRVFEEIGILALDMAGVDLSRLARLSFQNHIGERSIHCSPGLKFLRSHIVEQTVFFPSIVKLFIVAMTDKHSDELTTASFLKNAFDHEHQLTLNQQLASHVRFHGVDGVLVNDNIKRILVENGIELIQNKVNGTIELRGEHAVTDELEQRTKAIEQSLESLPTELTKIIAQFDQSLKICEKNRSYIIEILKSDDPVAKGELIAAASYQGQIQYLNAVMRQLRASGEVLNLSNVNLQGLDLHHIDLTDTNVTNANFQNAILSHAMLFHATLINANLNGAILTKTHLTQADLIEASTIGTDFEGAQI